MIEKPKTYRSSEYLEFVRKQKCAVCGKTPSDPHHLSAGGMGMKGSDLSSVPLCREHHTEIESIGVHTFSYKYRNIIGSTSEVLVKTLQAFVEWLEKKRGKK